MSISLKAKAVLFRQLATLVEGSVPLMRSMEILKKQTTNAKLKKIIDDLKGTFLKGGGLSEALGRYKNIFDPLEIALVKAGEMGGSLDRRLNNLAEELEKVYNLRLKIIGNLIYPLLLLHAGIFIPPIVTVVTNGFGYYAKTVLISLAVLYGGFFLIYGCYRLLKTVPELNTLLDYMILYIPLLGAINYKLSLARYFYNFGELFDAGINIYTSNELASGTCSNTVIRRKLATIGDLIKKGDTLTEALSKSGSIPGIAMGLIASGEESGRASSMYKKAAEYMDQEAEASINKLMIVLPLLLFLLLAAYIGYTIITFYLGYVNKIFNF